MRFRPCIDLHCGVVKQIVGSSLSAAGDSTGVLTNFASDAPPRTFASMYQADGLMGGHVIMLGPGNSDAAKEALGAFPQGMHVGGGITPANALEYIEAGASHVIVTSYVFKDGQIRYDRLDELVAVVGKEMLVLDLSCRKNPSVDDGLYYVCTDKWTQFTDLPVTADTLHQLSNYCDEFLVHGVDVEGKQSGVEEELVALLGASSPIPVTYAGGVRSLEDVELVKILGAGRVDVTIGSALDIFGGTLPYTSVVEWHKAQE